MEEIYINDIMSMTIIKVNKVKELNEYQTLTELNNRYVVVDNSSITTKEEYDDYIESLYQSQLKDFKEFITNRRYGNEALSKKLIERMIKDIFSEGK